MKSLKNFNNQGLIENTLTSLILLQSASVLLSVSASNASVLVIIIPPEGQHGQLVWLWSCLLLVLCLAQAMSPQRQIGKEYMGKWGYCAVGMWEQSSPESTMAQLWGTGEAVFKMVGVTVYGEALVFEVSRCEVSLGHLQDKSMWSKSSLAPLFIYQVLFFYAQNLLLLSTVPALT